MSSFPRVFPVNRVFSFRRVRSFKGTAGQIFSRTLAAVTSSAWIRKAWRNLASRRHRILWNPTAYCQRVLPFFAFSPPPVSCFHGLDATRVRQPGILRSESSFLEQSASSTVDGSTCRIVKKKSCQQYTRFFLFSLNYGDLQISNGFSMKFLKRIVES